MVLLLGIFLASGLVMIGLSVPLIRRQVGPNPLYGFRVRRTLEDPAVWYEANAYAGRGLFGVGLAECLAALLLFFVPGLGIAGYGLSVGGVVLAGLAVNLVLSFRYLGRLPPGGEPKGAEPGTR